MLKAIVLAAGKGRRLAISDSLPKVMYKFNGIPLLSYVLQGLSFIKPEDTIIVVGYNKDSIVNEIAGDYFYVEQTEQLGTGHAVMSALNAIDLPECDVLVCCGDMPLVKYDTYKDAMEYHLRCQSDCTLLTCFSDFKLDYGRVIRENGKFADIIEHRDCTDQQRSSNELNSGIYLFNSKYLANYLCMLDHDNAQEEYYLTDLPKMFVRDNRRVEIYEIKDVNEIYGVNTPDDLILCEQLFKSRDED